MAISASSNLQSLFAEFSQRTRLLQLTTPRGSKELLAECVRGEEGLGGGLEFAISALSTNAAIPLKSLIGQPALLQLLTAHNRDDARPFHGHITAVEHSGANGGLARYKLTLGPWTSFLAIGRDSRIFQDMSVFDIIDAVFSEYLGKGALAPEWRFDIADREVYPVRSLTTQYQESNLAFLERLMAEEGLFYFFQHRGDLGSATLGSHTVVIADHNGSFRPNVQSQIRFTQSSSVMKEDGLDRWRTELRQQTNALELSSWNYRSLNHRPPNSASADGGDTMLLARDALGPYAYESSKQGQRLADYQMQGLTARREVHVAAGTVRTLAPGSTFTLRGHALFDVADNDDARTFLIVRTVHLMHNNLSADLRAGVIAQLKAAALSLLIDEECATSLHTVGMDKGERPLYRNRIDAILSSTPYRTCVFDTDGRQRFQRPTVSGQQSAIVVGPAGSVIHTDRDHRVKVQFHWQRGAQSHSRLDHPAGANHTGAPADDRAGTWVRVATPLAPVAGANWGSHALPRVGQEVLVDFFEGDIDRPVVIGALYNGSGQADQQYNQVAEGTGVSTGNAPPWFPGKAGAHAHSAVLSGIKTQSMKTSQGGTGAYNQLVLDDSAGQARLSLQRHAAAHTGNDELNLGHLRHQTDNQRLQPSGFGVELKTAASAALRAGQGVLMSTDARPNAAGSQLDSGEAAAQIRHSMDLQKSMASTAQQHAARLADELAPEKLPAVECMQDSIAVLETSATGSEATPGDAGTGGVTAYSIPQLQLSAAAGIVAATPASAVMSSTMTSSITAGQDINLASQGSQFHAVMDGIGLFTYGKAGNADKPNQEVGIRLHAASGQVNAQSQSGEIRLTADKAITVASVTQNVNVGARENVRMTAQGAFLKLEGGNIMLHGPGKITFKASTKELSGPANGAFGAPELPTATPAYDEQFVVQDVTTGMLMANIAYRIVRGDGKAFTGITDEQGRTQRVHGMRADEVEFHFAGSVTTSEATPVTTLSGAATDSNTATSQPSTEGMAKAVGKEPAQRPKGVLNTTKGSYVVAQYQATRLYFRPEKFDVIVVPEAAAAKFEAHASEMQKVVNDFHAANMQVAIAINNYEKLRKAWPILGQAQRLKNAEKAYIKAHAKVLAMNAALRAKLAGLDSIHDAAAGGARIIELVPLRKNGRIGRRMIYVNSKEIDKSWKTVVISARPGASGAGPKPGTPKPETDPVSSPNTQLFKEKEENILGRDSNGKRTIDAAKLKQQLANIEPELKLELLNYEKYQVAGAIGAWCEAFNARPKFERQGFGSHFKNHVDLTAQAQLMRYVAGAGADAIWKPLEAKIGIKAEAKAQLALAEGTVSMTVYCPNRLGYQLTFSNMSKTKQFDVGLLRLQLQVVLAGVVGAHATAELGVDLVRGAFRPVPAIPGAPPALPPPAGTPPGTGTGPPASRPQPGEAKAELACFAGAKADLDMNGSVQWKNPEKKENDFEDFLKFAPGLSGMAGAGASLTFEISYKNGKFRMMIEASACLGFGGRGKIAFETNAALLRRFVIWFAYQLYNSNYEFLEYVGEEAFDALTHLQFLTIQSGEKVGTFLYDSANQIQAKVDAVLTILNNVERRNQLADRVIGDKKTLKYTTPEAKGMLLYQLTRHGAADTFNLGNIDFASMDVYTDRKKAVLKVLSWIQTSNEWSKVCWRVTKNGKPDSKGSWRGLLFDFLKLGRVNMSGELVKMENALKKKPARGYKIVANTSPAYKMYQSDHPEYLVAAMEPLSPVDAEVESIRGSTV